MKNTYSLEQTLKVANLDYNLILRQLKIDVKSIFVKINSNDQNLKQKQIAEQLVF